MVTEEIQKRQSSGESGDPQVLDSSSFSGSNASGLTIEGYD